MVSDQVSIYEFSDPYTCYNLVIIHKISIEYRSISQIVCTKY